MNDTATLFDDYLRRLNAAAHDLPGGQREELLAQIREHLDELRATLDAEDEVGAREALDRLGDPSHIVLEATDRADGTAMGTSGTVGPAPTRGKVRTPVFEMIAVILLLVGGFVFGVGWIAGAVMTWVSTQWTVRDKLLGTLVWPGGLAAVGLVGSTLPTQYCSGGSSAGFDEAGSAQHIETVPESCSGFALPQWLGIPVAVVLVLAPIVVAGYLLRRATAAKARAALRE